MKGCHRKNFFLLLFLSSFFSAESQELGLEEIYPLIGSLLPGESNLKQLQEDVAHYYQQAHAERELPPLGLYLYRVTKKDSLFTLAARFNLPYETLSTINRLSQKNALLIGQLLLIPNIPGLFLPARPRSELEGFFWSWREVSTDREALRILTPRGEEEFFFLPGERFHKIERAFFLRILFRSPIPRGELTSDYGWRISPITGKKHFHNGIDIAAPWNTAVFPAREGRVEALGRDKIYGNYVAIAHLGGYTTFYGHLDSILVELNQTVTSTMIIGRVGNTGYSTGPHLHFELRSSDSSLDPTTFLSGVER